MSHISLLLPVYLAVSMVTGTINFYNMYCKHNSTYNVKLMMMNTWISLHPLNCLLISEITLIQILSINIFTEEWNLSKMKSGLTRKLNNNNFQPYRERERERAN